MAFKVLRYTENHVELPKTPSSKVQKAIVLFHLCFIRSFDQRWLL